MRESETGLWRLLQKKLDNCAIYDNLGYTVSILRLFFVKEEEL